MVDGTLAGLSDEELVAEVRRLGQGARATTAGLVAHLAEMERRQLHLAAGFPSLFAYCTEVLRLSEYEAFGRIEAARAARRHPRVVDMLSDGSLTPSTAQLLARNLTSENHEELLAAAAGKSKYQVQELLVRHAPQPDAPPTVRKLPAPRTPVTPLAPERYQITFTASATTRDKLRSAQDLLRHAIPSGDTAQVIDRALTALLEDLARKKLGATDRPRASPPAAEESRHIPAGVKRAVWARDGGRCAFLGPDSRRCGETAFVEFHHVDAFARGGPATIANIELRCRAHNAYQADLEFGHRRPGGEWAVH